VELISQFIDIVLHLDLYLETWSVQIGGWLYLVLFVIVFCETGLVVTPFLPGDSLLFATGAVISLPGSPLSLGWTIALLIAAAVIGDAVNYSVGLRLGNRILSRPRRWLKHEHLERTQRFYERHGGKTIVLARFVPIIRTFAPFVAGLGKMAYRRFAVYNVSGAVVWVVGFVVLGFLFGRLPVVKRNFQLVVLGIIILSVMPIAFEWYRAWREKRTQARAAAE
jgi:membrane-associated protein